MKKMIDVQRSRGFSFSKSLLTIFLIALSLSGWAQATLPLSRTAWGTTPTGWTDNAGGSYATTFACSTTDGGKFATSGDNYIVNFSTTPGTVTFTTKATATPTGCSLALQESSNGSTWTAVSGTITLATSCTSYGPFSLLSTTRYVKWTYTKSGSVNLTIDDVSITSGCTAPTVSISGTTPGCGSVTLTASGTTGNTYVWSNSGGSTSTATYSSSGTYSVTATNSGCTASASKAIVVNSNPTVSISGTATACGQVSLTASGTGSSYVWSGGNSTTTAVNTFSSTGTYTVTSTLGSCTASASQAITVNPNPTLSITGTTPGCNLVTLTASGTGTSYSWSAGGGSSASASYATTGTYSVTATLGSCTATASQAITVNTSTTSIAPTTTQNITTGANGTPLTVSEGTSSPSSRQWAYSTTPGGPYTTLGVTTTTYTPNFGSVGTYHVVCQTTYGAPCSNTVTSNEVTINVTSNSITTGTISGSPFCQGVSGLSVPFTYSAAASFPAGTTTFTAQLSDATGSFASPTTLQSVASDASGIQSISVTIPSGATAGTAYRIRVVSNTPAVSGTDNGANLTIKANPTLSVSGTTTACATVSLTASGTGTSYTWSGGSSTGTAANTFTSSGTYTVTSTLSGCTATASAVVTVNPNPTLSISGTTPGCSSVTLTASGTGASYAWSGGSTPSAASNTFTTSATYTVTSTLGSCTATASQAVSIVAAPSISAQPSTGAQTICSGGSLTALSVTASNFTGYQWYINSANNNTTGTLISGATAATYTPSNTLIGTNYYYCVISGNSPCASVTSNVSGAITVNTQPTTPIISGSTTGCTSVILTAASTTGSTYTWSGGSTPSAATNTFTASGTYRVTATIGTCTATASSSVTLSTYNIVASAGANGAISPSGTTTVTCGANQTYTITPNSCYSIADVLVDGSSVGAVSSYTFSNVTAAHTISATFVINGPYNLTASAGANGSISSAGVTSATCGTSKTYTITPNTCYAVSDVQVDGVSQGAITTYTFSNVTAPHTISATFAAAGPFNIVASTGTGGSISPSGTTSVTCGGSQTYTITPSTGYTVASVSVDGVSQGAITTYTFSNVTAGHTISATFTPQVLYLHNFNDGPSGSPYTTSPTATSGTPTGVFATNLSSSSWTNGSGTLTSFAGNSGQALALQPPTSATTLTLTFSVASGYQCSILGFDFWRQKSSSGPGNITSITVNGTTITPTSISVPNSGSFVGYTGVANAVNNITGTVTVVLNLSAATASGSNIRLDEFTLYGYVIPSCTTPTLAGASLAGSACVGSGAVVNLTGLVSGSTNNALDYTINGVAQTQVTGVNATGTTASFTMRALTAADNGQSVVITKITNSICSTTFTTSAGTLSVNPLPATPTFTGPFTGCSSVAVTASSTAGSTYAWSAGSTPSAATNTFTTSGTYTVTATLSGCTASASQAVTVTASPTASISGTATGCSSVSLTASGGTTYAWSGGSTPSAATNTFTTSGTYTVTVSNSCGSATATVAVTVNTPPSTPTFSGTTTACTSVTLTASSTAGSTFAWSGGSTPSAASNTFTSSGTYTVTATRNGCTATASQAVTVNTAPVITTQPSNLTVSTGSTATFSVTATGTGLTYQWMKGGSNISGATSATYSIPAAALTDAGSYSVKVTGTCGNVTSNTVTLTVVTFVYRTGDYRSVASATTLAANNSSTTATNNWEYFDGTSWGPTPGGKAPANATTTPSRVIIAPGTFVDGAGNNSKSYNNIVIQNGGWLDLAATGTPTADFILSGDTLEVQSGGYLSIEGQISINSNAKLIVRNGGILDIESPYIDNRSLIWAGTENFEPGSEVYIGNWAISSSGSGSLYNTGTYPSGNISNNANGYKFGILSIDVDLAGYATDWTLVGGSVTVKLCDTLNVDNTSNLTYAVNMMSNTSSPNVTIGRLNLNTGYLALTACFSGSATQTLNILENVNAKGNGALTLFHNSGGSASNATINLTGNLSVASTVLFDNEAASSTSSLNFNGTSTQYIDAATQPVSIPMNILSGAYVMLKNQDLDVTGYTGVSAAITVKSGGTLDFGFAPNNTTALVIKKTVSGGTNTFVTEQGSTLKITSPDGIQQASATLGNVQFSSGNKTFNQLATFWYTGHANQVTGDALGTSSNGKQIIVDLLNKSISLTLTQSTGLTSATTISATGGKLDIRTGQFLETATAYITGSTGALTMAAGTLYQIPALSTSSTDLIPRMDGSLLSNSYTLNGGTIELSGAGAQTLRGNRTYFNVKFSGSNIYGTNYKNLSAATTVNDSLIISGPNTVVNCVDASANAISFTGDGGLVMDGGRIMIKNLSTTQPVLTGITIPYSLTGGTVEFYGSNTSTQQALRATDGNGNTISYYNVDINADGANTTSYNVNPTASFGIKGNFNVYSPAVFQLDETDNVTGTGNFAINTGATFKYGSPNGIKTSGTGTTDGNIRISGTRTLPSTASYGFVGNGDMVSGNGLPSSMVNLYVQKSGTSDIVTLTNTATASGVISFTKGRISTGSNELVSSNTSTSSITGHGLNKYVIGNLRRYVASSGSYDFPVGNTSYYDLGTINFNGQSGVTSLLGFFNTGQSGTAPSTSTCQINGSKIADYLNNGFWTFTPNSTMTSGTYDVTLNAMGYSNAPSLVTRMGVIKRSNASSPWLGCGLLNGVAQSSTYGTHSNATQSISGGVATATRTGVTGFSDFGIGIHQTNTPLPVTLMYLTATPADDRYIALEWATASEINNSGFQVERSTDGINFEPIAWVDGHGNSNAMIKYNTNDQQVATGIIYYYRLKQVDYDGKYDYSNIVSATLSGGNSGITIHNIYPNPASGQVTIDIVAANDQPIAVSITDMLGREVITGQWQLHTGFNDRKYDISSLADGVYHVTVKAGNSYFTKVLAVTK